MGFFHAKLSSLRDLAVPLTEHWKLSCTDRGCFILLFYNDSTLENSSLKFKNRGPWLGKPGLCKRSGFCFVLFEGGRGIGMLETWLSR